MLTRFALMFVLHVLVLGVVWGRRFEFIRMTRLGWVFVYLLVFYVGWGLVFASFPNLIVPEKVQRSF